MEQKIILGYVSSAIILVAYIPYIVHILRKKTHPHAFSWFVWSLLTATAFGIQLSENAGAGAWIWGVTSSISIAVFFLAMLYGERNIVRLDWIFLIGALTAFMFWWFADQPFLSIILLTTTDACGYLPTFRKSFHRPFEETSGLYILGTMAYVVSLFALAEVNVLTALYPSAIITMNILLVTFIWLRRSHISKAK
jgi:hypothetical protein